MRGANTAVIAWTLCAIGSSVAHGQPNKVLYELQEHCGLQAAATFKNEWGSNVVKIENGHTLANFENHYSPRPNKCFYLEISTTYEKGKPPFKKLRLYDLHENKEYATFIEGLVCDVHGQDCTSEPQWRELIKPFMED